MVRFPAQVPRIFARSTMNICPETAPRLSTTLCTYKVGPTKDAVPPVGRRVTSAPRKTQGHSSEHTVKAAVRHERSVPRHEQVSRGAGKLTASRERLVPSQAGGDEGRWNACYCMTTAVRVASAHLFLPSLPPPTPTPSSAPPDKPCPAFWTPWPPEQADSHVVQGMAQRLSALTARFRAVSNKWPEAEGMKEDFLLLHAHQT